MLTAADVPTQQRNWLAGQLLRLADSPAVGDLARAHDYDVAAPVIQQAIRSILTKPVDEPVDEVRTGLSTRYLDDETFQTALNQATARLVYDTARQPADDAPPDTQAGGRELGYSPLQVNAVFHARSWMYRETARLVAYQQLGRAEFTGLGEEDQQALGADLDKILNTLKVYQTEPSVGCGITA